MLATFASGLFLSSLSHAEMDEKPHADWITDFEAAKAKAKAEDKPILVDFTGSDWCGWCIKLDKEVFTKASFTEYASENLVLLEIDFPSKKVKQSAELKAQNKAMAEKYGIKGFPTILLLDAEGKVIERTGYKRGGPEKYVEHLKSLLAAKQ